MPSVRFYEMEVAGAEGGKMIRYVALVPLLLAGCALTPQMSSDQLTAAGNNPNATATVVSYTGAGGQGTFTTLNSDRGALGTNGGTAMVEPNGKISIVVNPRAEPAPRPVTCAALAYERGADGTCAEIRRGATCLVNSTARVESNKCPAP